MDGIRKSKRAIKNVERPVIKQPLNPAQKTPIVKKEDLYISRHEARQMDLHEKRFQKGLNLKKIIKNIFIAILLPLLIAVSYLTWKAYSVGKKINSNAQTNSSLTQDMRAIISPVIPSNVELKGQETGRINILLLGAAGEKKPGGNLTDTIMIMSINTKDNKIALLSLPRDFYAPIKGSKSFAKINSLYPIGIKEGQDIELIKSAVEEITSLTINYHFVLDFEGFEKIVDDIGGINVVSERDIYDSRYPGPNYSYETFELSKGFHTLDGKTALKYVRERHADPEGDFGRAKRQQQVMQSTKNKLFSMQTILNVVTLNNILNTLGDNIRTDITIADLEGFVSLSKKLDLENITNVVVDAWKKDSLLKVSHVQMGAANAFILIPRVGNYTEIQDVAKNIFNQDELKRRQAMIEEENAKIIIVNKSGDYSLGTKIKALLSERLGMKDVRILSYNSEDSQTITTVTQKENSNKIYTLDELIKKIPAKLSDNDFIQTDETYDLKITLGSDILESYKYEEDNISMEEFNNKQEDNNSVMED